MIRRNDRLISIYYYFFFVTFIFAYFLFNVFSVRDYTFYALEAESITEP